MPFVRGGWSDGKAAAVDANITAGVGLRPFDHEADLFGVAFGWASPSAGGLRDQYTAEMFYRLQVLENVAITPDIQMIVNPSLSPLGVLVPGGSAGTDLLFAGAIRLRATF